MTGIKVGVLRLGLTVAAMWLMAYGKLDAGKYNPVLKISDPGPQWKSLPGIDGKKYSFDSFKKFEVLVIVFTCNSCDYAVDYEDRLVAFARNHTGAGKRVGMVAVNVNRIPADSLPEMKRRAEKKGFTFPYLFDETQETARAYDAVCTPDIFVYGQEGKLMYRGRVDDNWKEPNQVKQRDLQAAVDHILVEKEVSSKQIPSMGCSIKWK